MTSPNPGFLYPPPVTYDLAKAYRAMSRLKPDWDSYGGTPPTKKVLETLRHVHVSPTTDGGLHWEWCCNGWDVMVEFGPGGELVGAYYRTPDGREWEEDFA